MRSKCAECGAVPREGFRFCDDCGAALLACAKCGHANLPAYSFCEECAAKLDAPKPTIAVTRRVPWGVRWGVVGALALAATAVGVILNRDGGADTPPLTEGASTGAALTTRSDGSFRLANRSADPNGGFTDEDPDGSTIVYTGTTWYLISPEGSGDNVWHYGATVANVRREGEQVIVEATASATPDDLSWMTLNLRSPARELAKGKWSIPLGTRPPQPDGGGWFGGENGIELVRDPNAKYTWSDDSGGHWQASGDDLSTDRYGFKFLASTEGSSVSGPGPGGGADGMQPGLFPKDPYVTDMHLDAQAAWTLAREWFPYVELSKNEGFGEILRIGAQVFMYNGRETRVHRLEQAVHVEIVYTLYFKVDGGLGGTGQHAGDNEGFVVGLTRTDRNAGRCATGFALAAAKTRGHLDYDTRELGFWKGNAADAAAFVLSGRWDAGPYISEVSEDWLDREPGWCPNKIGTKLSSANSYPENEFVVLVSENKHATYFDRKHCDASLSGVHDALRDLVSGGIFGKLPLATVGGSVVVEVNATTWWRDFLLDKILFDRLAGTLGLENCYAGRQPYGTALAARVELLHLDDDFNEKYVAHDSDKGDVKVSYRSRARGDWFKDSEPVRSCNDYPDGFGLEWYIDNVRDEGGYHALTGPGTSEWQTNAWDEVDQPPVPPLGALINQPLVDTCAALAETGALVRLVDQDNNEVEFVDDVRDWTATQVYPEAYFQPTPSSTRVRGEWYAVAILEGGSRVEVPACNDLTEAVVRDNLEARGFVVQRKDFPIASGAARAGYVDHCEPGESTLQEAGSLVTMYVRKAADSTVTQPEYDIAGHWMSTTGASYEVTWKVGTNEFTYSVNEFQETGTITLSPRSDHVSIRWVNQNGSGSTEGTAKFVNGDFSQAVGIEWNTGATFYRPEYADFINECDRWIDSGCTVIEF